MAAFGKIEDLLVKRKNVFLILFLLIFIQLIYSFLFPAYDIRSDYWKSIKELDFYKGYSFSFFDNSIVEKIYPLISNYHINADVGGEILLAHDFPQHYFRGHFAFLHRPLYAFLVYLTSRPLHLISDSYSLTFAAGIFLNFALFFFTVYLFYLLVQKIISSRVALLSSILLIFSPFAHVWLTQPETNIFGAFAVIFSFYLLYNYIASPTTKKLIIFSLIIGFLMLGKMLYVISLFILILAVYFKRYKEGTLFLIIHLTPMIFWYLWVTKIFGLNYYSPDITEFKMFLMDNWLLNIFQRPWYESAKVFLSALPNFFASIVYGFLLLPVILAFIGFKKLSFEKKNIFCFSLISAFFILFFIVMNYYTPRHGFLLYPIIYPLAVLGIDRIANFLKRYKNWYSPAFYLVVFIFLIIISSVNIFEIFPYDGNSPWWQ